jgi:hypothetical protein
MAQMLPCNANAKAAPGTKHIINVEIDGPRHANARTRLHAAAGRAPAWLAACSGALGPDVTGQQKKGTMRSCRTFEI